MSLQDRLEAHRNWVVAQGSDIPRPQMDDKTVAQAIAKDLVGLLGDDEKPSKVFVPKERGFTEALNADVRNELRAELRQAIIKYCEKE